MDVEQMLLEDVVDAAQAAVILGVTRQHVVHLCRTERLPCRRLTATWITTRQAVEEYAGSRRGPGRPKTRPTSIDDNGNIILKEDDQDRLTVHSPDQNGCA